MNRRKNDKSKRVRASEVVARRNVYLVIDGYNLMHVTCFKPLSQQAGELQRCRHGLLALLAERLPATQYREVKVVFDSRQASKRLPTRQRYQHLDIVFARHENSADDWIAQYVQRHPHWQQLVVVSSDHRVQNSARRRKATTLDSEDWFDALLDDYPANEVSSQDPADPELDSKVRVEMDEQELAEFTDEMTEGLEHRVSDQGSDQQVAEEFENPFPEGYFDDLESHDE